MSYFTAASSPDSSSLNRWTDQDGATGVFQHHGHAGLAFQTHAVDDVNAIVDALVEGTEAITATLSN